MPRTTAKKAGPTIGQQIIEGLTELAATAEAGGMAAIRRKFTVRHVKRMPFVHPALGPGDIAAIRNSLNASQPVFARMIGVSPGTIRAWEQGRKTPSTLARCLLAEVKRNRTYWQARLKSAERRSTRPRP
jgi:putative transcriptional regulator